MANMSSTTIKMVGVNGKIIQPRDTNIKIFLSLEAILQSNGELIILPDSVLEDGSPAITGIVDD